MSSGVSRSSQYAGQCAACLYRNELIVQNAVIASSGGKTVPRTYAQLVDWVGDPTANNGKNGVAQIRQENLWYWCSATGKCNTGQQPCSDPTIASRCVSGRLFRAAPGADNISCPCTSCSDDTCLSDYVNPACNKQFEPCGCRPLETAVEETFVGNRVSNRVSGRGQLVCPFGSLGSAVGTAPETFAPPNATPQKLDMRRKAQILLHERNAARLTSKQKWAQLVRSKGSRGVRSLASRVPRPLRPKGGNPNILFCPGPGPSKCSPASSCDVPRSPDPSLNIICMDKSVPLTRYRHREVLLSAVGSTWPQTRWEPGYHGFPVGKAGSSPYEQLLAEEEDEKRGSGTGLFNHDISFRVQLPSVQSTLCNRFGCDDLTLLVCVDSAGNLSTAKAEEALQNKFKFSWRSPNDTPFDVNGLESDKHWPDVATYSRPLEQTPCSGSENWGGLDISELKTRAPGTIKVMEPTSDGVLPGSWERTLIEAIAGSNKSLSIAENKTDALKLSQTYSDFTCCGPGAFFPIQTGGNDRTVGLGRLQYSGALTWSVTEEYEPARDDLATIAPLPDVVGPGGAYTFQRLVDQERPYSGENGQSPFCSENGGGPVSKPAKSAFVANSARELASIAVNEWASGRGPASGYSGRGCGQPFTLSRWGPPSSPAAAYECEAASNDPCTDSYTQVGAQYYGPDSVSPEQNPHELGGAWAPGCAECDVKAVNSTSGLSATDRYITITLNFGAYSGPSYTALLDKKLRTGLSGGMGQWGPDSSLLGRTESSQSAGLFPELYSVTWYIDIDSLSPAKSHDRAVDAWCVVVGRPSSGQYVDPRPIVGAYVATGNTKTIDTGRAGGGLLGYGGSVIGTQAGGLGVRGCSRKPAVDVQRFSSSDGLPVRISLCR